MPPSLSPILVPTDFSAPAAEALAYALAVARATGAEVHLLHVLAWPDAGPFEAPREAPTAAAEEQEEDRRAHEALATIDAPASLSRAVRRNGVPGLGIVAYAEEIDAGLIVIGTCGRSARRFGLGAVAGEVVQTAPCDVLLVPFREDAPFSRAPVRRVLIPIDFSSASRPLATFGTSVARTLGAAEADLVHVLEPLPYPVRWLDEAVVDLVPAVRERAQQALRDLADEVQPPPVEPGAGGALEIGLYVERGKAARTLARVVEALGSDLVVVGPHAERPVFDRLLGSVAEGLARRAGCPVLVARRSAAPAPHAEPLVDPQSYEPTPA